MSSLNKVITFECMVCKHQMTDKAYKIDGRSCEKCSGPIMRVESDE